jgi:hypothetical protein
MVRPSRSAFFQCVPGVAAPALNGRFVALAGPHDRLLAAPAQPFEQASHVRRMVCHAKLRLDQGCHARLGPHFPWEAARFRPALQQFQQSGHLDCAEAGDSALSRLATQRLRPVFFGACQPLADRTSAYS